MSQLHLKPSGNQQKLSTKFLRTDNGIGLFALGAVGAFIALCIANGMDVLHGIVIPSHFNSEQMIKTRVFMIVAASIGGFSLGWFLSPQAQAFRVLLLGALVSILAFFAIVDYGALGSTTSFFAACAAFFIGFGYWARKAAKGMADRFKETPNTFGSAKWARFKELVERGLINKDGIQLGQVRGDDGAMQPVSYSGDQHGVVIGATRTKKGTSFVIPNLLTHEGSALVLDIKGENAMITADHRKRMGQAVLTLDPHNITDFQSARLNPMDFIISGGIESGDNAMILGAAIVQFGESKEVFFHEEGKAVIVGLMLHVAFDPSEDGQRHLGRVRDLLMLEGDDLKALFKNMMQSPHAIARSTGSKCLQKDEKLLSNIFATAQSHTNFLDSPALRENLSYSDFKYEDLKSKNMTVYLCMPADKLEAHSAWMRIHIQQALTVNARNIEIKPDKPILFILDEMPTLGRLPMVETAFGLMAGFGMQLLVICQSAGQLKSLYKDNWETFFSNAGFIQYLGSQDEFTSEYFSKLCGVTTVWNWSSAVARAFSVTRSKETSTSNSTTSTDTTSATQRKLAYADELRRMDEDDQLLIIRKCDPILAQKQDWFANPDLKELGVNLYAKDE